MSIYNLEYIHAAVLLFALISFLVLVPSQLLSKEPHVVEAIPENMVRGNFDPNRAPVLTVNSGDIVTIHNVWATSPEGLPDDEVADAIKAAFKAMGQGDMGPHFLTGPIAVRGARPGDVLEVKILDVQLKADWGWNMIAKGKGSLPKDFDFDKRVIVLFDRNSMTGSWVPGIKVPLNPFFGIMAVAPPKTEGKKSSIPPDKWGGNMDNKRLGKGATLYLPIWTEEALFFAGDGHAAQGNGEVCLTAIETSLIGIFQFTVRKDMKLQRPVAETPSHFITMGFDPDLYKAFEIALREMIEFITGRWKISREDAYRVASVAVDFNISQVVDVNKGVHGLLPRSVILQK